MLPRIMEKFILDLEERGKTSKTIKAYRTNLQDFIDSMFNGEEPDIKDYNDVLYEDAMEWLLQRKSEGLRASSLNQRTATLSSFYSYLQVKGIVNKNIFKLMGKFTDDIVYENVSLTSDEASMLLQTATTIAATKKTYSDYRNEMIIKIFLSTGLRIDELHNISVEDVDLNKGVFTVIGKRGKRRNVCLHPKVLRDYRNYIEVRNKQKNSCDNALFLSRQRSSEGYRLSTDQIRRIVIQLAKEAKVTKITPHSLRHTCATLLIKEGAQLVEVSNLLGHANTEITAKLYIHQSESNAINMANKLSIF